MYGSVVRLLIFHNRLSKIIGQEVRLMIDYNRKLSNERKTQVPSQRMSILVLLYKKS